MQTFPRHPVIFSADDWGVQSPPKRMVFWFHYHSQKLIGSLRIAAGVFVSYHVLLFLFLVEGLSETFPG